MAVWAVIVRDPLFIGFGNEWYGAHLLSSHSLTFSNSSPGPYSLLGEQRELISHALISDLDLRPSAPKSSALTTLSYK